VEGEIRDGIPRLGIRAGPVDPHIPVASRTDRGVSARANVLALESPLAPAALLRALNGIAPEIHFTAAGALEPTTRLRGATRRTYRYYEPPGPHRPAVWRRAARSLIGEIDVRSFGRGVARTAPLRRTVDAIRVEEHEGGLCLEISGPSFVWNQVRKLVAALRLVDAGRLSEARLAAAARGEVRLTLPLAEPERLLLWEVELPIVWTTGWQGPNRQQRAYLAARRAEAWTRARVLRDLAIEPARS
jgi:tRNA pseudouridine(38-40) synthase